MSKMVALRAQKITATPLSMPMRLAVSDLIQIVLSFSLSYPESLQENKTFHFRRGVNKVESISIHLQGGDHPPS